MFVDHATDGWHSCCRYNKAAQGREQSQSIGTISSLLPLSCSIVFFFGPSLFLQSNEWAAERVCLLGRLCIMRLSPLLSVCPSIQCVASVPLLPISFPIPSLHSLHCALHPQRVPPVYVNLIAWLRAWLFVCLQFVCFTPPVCATNIQTFPSPHFAFLAAPQRIVNSLFFFTPINVNQTRLYRNAERPTFMAPCIRRSPRPCKHCGHGQGP